ncbi:MAG: sigma-70 family RNA polymerase sigma factor [Candidatus Lokiarchaeota archaeon]|nr:sigma-70 family RNA polymerase sigma factor [Candidatus Lokiarchaeota archaeon]
MYSNSKSYDIYYTQLYLKGIGPIKKLTAYQERKLIIKYKSGDINALHELVIKNQYIIIKIALSFINKGIELLDIIQEANVACILAINNYTFEKGNFKNHLNRNIFRHLQNIAPGFYSIIRYPHNAIYEINRFFHNNQDDKINSQPITKKLIKSDITTFKYSLLNFISYNDFDTNADFISDRLDIELDSLSQHTFKSVEFKLSFFSFMQELRDVLKILDISDQKVIMWYYGLLDKKSYTYEEIGKKMNLTRERIRQIHNRALDRLKLKSRSDHLRIYLSLFYPDPELISFEGESIIHYGLNMSDQNYAISLLKKYIKVRRRITPYPEIPNIAEACRELITEFLKQHGEPCSYNKIKDIVYEKYPLLKNGALVYALSTAEDIINIKRGLYALRDWVFTEDISTNNIQKLSLKKETKTNNKKLELNELALNKLEFTENQLNLINYFLENLGQLSKLKITVFSRSNQYDFNQLVNSINKQFIENFNDPLIKEENSNFFLNNKYLA